MATKTKTAYGIDVNNNGDMTIYIQQQGQWYSTAIISNCNPYGKKSYEQLMDLASEVLMELGYQL